MPFRGIIEPDGFSESKRGSPRVHLKLEVPSSLDAKSPNAVVVHNLSTSGLLIETKSPLHVGETLFVHLPESGDVSAEVVWTSGELFGCRFTHPLPKAALSAAQLLNPLPPELDPSQIRSPAPETLPQRLVRLRKARGLRRAELAARAEVSRPSIWAWESGRTAPRQASLSALARALNVSEEELQGEGGENAIPHGAISSSGSDASGTQDAAASAKELERHVDDCRKLIAEIAGVSPEKVRISLDL